MSLNTCQFGPVAIIVLMMEISFVEISCESVMLLDTSQDEWRGWKTNSGRYAGWRTQNIPPNGDKVYGICNINRDDNDNWLYSPSIPLGEASSIIIETYFSMRNCRNYPDPTKLKSCDDAITLYTYESDHMIEPSSPNNGLFKQVAVLHSKNKWVQSQTDSRIMDSKNVSIPVSKLSLQIGYRDTGSCTMIRRVRVFYMACPAVVDVFTDFPRTVAKHDYEIVNVKGTCVKGAEQKIKNTNELQHRFCQSNGFWHDMGITNCHCSPGYTADADFKKCIPCASGTYKPVSGSGKCSYCPRNSNSEIGQAECVCDKGYGKKFIGSHSNIQMVCLAPPNVPENVKANLTDGWKVMIKWKQRFFSRQDEHDETRYFNVACFRCSNEGLVYDPGENVTGTNVTIYGLNFGESYIFHITAIGSIENHSASLQNPSQASVRFSMPKTNGLSIKTVRIIRLANSSFLISWSDPANVTNVELYMIQILNVFVTNFTTIRTSYSYVVTKSNSYVYSPNAFANEIQSRVRFKANGLWSNFSINSMENYQKKESMLTEEGIDKMNPENSALWWFPNVDAVLLFVSSAVLILIILTITVIVLRRHVHSSLKQTDDIRTTDMTYIDNTKSSYASISTSIPSRARSCFLLSSVDTLVPQTRSVNEIPSELIIVGTMHRPGTFCDTYDGYIRHLRRIPLKVTLNIIKPDTPEDIRKRMIDDVLEMSQFLHENIVSLLGLSGLGNTRMIILDCMANGMLNSFLKAHKSKIDICQLLQFIRDIACGMNYLSERKFIHKRLTSFNVFLDELLVCKVAVFMPEWYHTDLKPKTKQNELLDLVPWMAPELYDDGIFSIYTDIWSFGIVMWEILTCGERPYWNWSPETICKAVTEGYRLPTPISCSQSLHNMMVSCWSPDDAQRPLWSTVLSKLDHAINYTDEKTITILNIDNIPKCLEKSNQNIIDSRSTASVNLLPSPLIPKNHIQHTSLDSIITNEYCSLNVSRKSLKNQKSYSTVSADLSSIFVDFPRSTTNLRSLKSLKNISQKESATKSNSNFSRFIKGSKINLGEWLSEINLKKYHKILKKNGYDSRTKLANISILNLTRMGIKNASEIQTLLNNAHLLQTVTF